MTVPKDGSANKQGRGLTTISISAILANRISDLPVGMIGSFVSFEKTPEL